MIFPTVTETTPRPQAVTPDHFLGAPTDSSGTRAREAAALGPGDSARRDHQ
jgi:hypothetical protein